MYKFKQHYFKYGIGCTAMLLLIILFAHAILSAPKTQKTVPYNLQGQYITTKADQQSFPTKTKFKFKRNKVIIQKQYSNSNKATQLQIQQLINRDKMTQLSKINKMKSTEAKNKLAKYYEAVDKLIQKRYAPSGVYFHAFKNNITAPKTVDVNNVKYIHHAEYIKGQEVTLQYKIKHHHIHCTHKKQSSYTVFKVKRFKHSHNLKYYLSSAAEGISRPILKYIKK